MELPKHIFLDVEVALRRLGQLLELIITIVAGFHGKETISLLLPESTAAPISPAPPESAGTVCLRSKSTIAPTSVSVNNRPNSYSTFSATLDCHNARLSKRRKFDACASNCTNGEGRIKTQAGSVTTRVSSHAIHATRPPRGVDCKPFHEHTEFRGWMWTVAMTVATA